MHDHHIIEIIGGALLYVLRQLDLLRIKRKRRPLLHKMDIVALNDPEDPKDAKIHSDSNDPAQRK